MRSLHLFMEAAPHTWAVRFYAGEWSVTHPTTPTGKSYHLLNLSYYMVSQLLNCLEWFLFEYPG